jgi:hypothetical protein
VNSVPNFDKPADSMNYIITRFCTH